MSALVLFLSSWLDGHSPTAEWKSQQKYDSKEIVPSCWYLGTLAVLWFVRNISQPKLPAFTTLTHLIIIIIFINSSSACPPWLPWGCLCVLVAPGDSAWTGFIDQQPRVTQASAIYYPVCHSLQLPQVIYPTTRCHHSQDQNIIQRLTLARYSDKWLAALLTYHSPSYQDQRRQHRQRTEKRIPGPQYQNYAWQNLHFTLLCF